MQPAFALARPFKKVANATFRAKLGATRRNRAQPDATPCTMPRKGLRSKLPSWRDFRKKPESLLQGGCHRFESCIAHHALRAWSGDSGLSEPSKLGSSESWSASATAALRAWSGDSGRRFQAGRAKLAWLERVLGARVGFASAGRPSRKVAPSPRAGPPWSPRGAQLTDPSARVHRSTRSRRSA